MIVHTRAKLNGQLCAQFLAGEDRELLEEMVQAVMALHALRTLALAARPLRECQLLWVQHPDRWRVAGEGLRQDLTSRLQAVGMNAAEERRLRNALRLLENQLQQDQSEHEKMRRAGHSAEDAAAFVAHLVEHKFVPGGKFAHSIASAVLTSVCRESLATIDLWRH